MLLLLAVRPRPCCRARTTAPSPARSSNKTSGGGSTGGTNVLLVAFGRKEQAPLGQQTATADADGRYTFTGARSRSERRLPDGRAATGRELSRRYAVPAHRPGRPPGRHRRSTTRPPPTTRSSWRRLNLLVMGADKGIVQLMQMGALVNNGDRTFVTANPQDQQLARAIKFALPRGALGVQMQSGFNDQDVIPGVERRPGHQPDPARPARVRPVVPVALQRLERGRQPAGAVSDEHASACTCPIRACKLQSSALPSGGPTQLGGQTYSIYTASNVAKATMIAEPAERAWAARAAFRPTSWL